MALKADCPVQVAQYTPSSLDNSGFDGDPSMIMLPALENYDNKYTFSTPAANLYGLFENDMIIAIKSGMQEGLRLNDTVVGGVDWAPLDGDDSMVCHLSLQFAQ